MKYTNAIYLLPKELIEELQDFVEGEYLYIPKKKKSRKKWGELSGARQEIDKRDKEIKKAYTNGCSVEELSDRFYLSTYAIRKIIYKK